MDVTGFFKQDNSLVVEAVEELLAAESELTMPDLDHTSWRKARERVRRCEDNLDCILYRLGTGGIGKLGNLAKVFAYAVVYRAVGRKLFNARSPTPLTKERKRYWYNRRDDTRKRLVKAIAAWGDDEAVKNGKTIVWHLMLKRKGHSVPVLSSTDPLYIKIEYRDAMRKLEQGDMYFIAKEYK